MCGNLILHCSQHRLNPYLFDFRAPGIVNTHFCDNNDTWMTMLHSIACILIRFKVLLSSYSERSFTVPGSSLPIDEHVYCFIKASLSLQNSKNSFTTVSYSTKTRFSQCYSVTPWIPPYTRSLHIHCVLYYLCYDE